MQLLHADRDMVAIAAGGYHTLLLYSDGSVRGFGANGWGQAGITFADRSDLVSIPSPRKVQLPVATTAIAAGELHSLSVTTEGEVYAWGRNFHGQLGHGDIVDTKEKLY